jgi:hypothetical protein
LTTTIGCYLEETPAGRRLFQALGGRLRTIRGIAASGSRDTFAAGTHAFEHPSHAGDSSDERKIRTVR